MIWDGTGRNRIGLNGINREERRGISVKKITGSGKAGGRERGVQRGYIRFSPYRSISKSMPLMMPIYARCFVLPWRDL